jgi:hypothetical protein
VAWTSRRLKRRQLRGILAGKTLRDANPRDPNARPGRRAACREVEPTCLGGEGFRCAFETEDEDEVAVAASGLEGGRERTKRQHGHRRRSAAPERPRRNGELRSNVAVARIGLDLTWQRDHGDRTTMWNRKWSREDSNPDV